MPSRQVGGDRRRRAHDPEGEGLDEDPADQVLVVVAAGERDRAAEDVGEQQHEHQRLDRDVEQLLGDLADVREVAPGEDEAVGQAEAQVAAMAVIRRRPPSGRRSAGSVSGEEDVVERRLAAVQVGGVDAGGVERAHDLGERRRRRLTGTTTRGSAASTKG